jgi:hypothetical protein
VDHILTNNPETKKRVEWLEGVKKVPFYSWDFKSSTMEWERDSHEINFTGNEADGEDESCVYVSYALLILADKADA